MDWLLLIISLLQTGEVVTGEVLKVCSSGVQSVWMGEAFAEQTPLTQCCLYHHRDTEETEDGYNPSCCFEA